MSSINYQDAFNTNAANSQGSIDRARGGKISISLTIPSKTYTDSDGDSHTTDEMKVSFEIDLELMPLVNVAGYGTNLVQTGPEEIKYPNGNVKYEKTFA